MNIKKIFYADVKEKKRTAGGAYHKTGTRGYIGKVRYPSEMLRGKEKREYQGTGKVVTFNMYDTIISYEEFKTLNDNDKKLYLTKYREKFLNKEIMEKWGISHNVFYKIVRDLGLTDRRNARIREKVSNLPVVVKTEVTPNTKDEDIKKGFSISLQGEYTAEDLSKKLEKIGLIISDEPVTYKVSIVISD